MPKHNIQNLKDTYVGMQFGWLTITDIYKSDTGVVALCKCKCGNEKEIAFRYVINYRTKSCGCYLKSKEFSDNRTEWCKSHPDEVAAANEKHLEWIKNNKDAISAQGKAHSEWFKSNPDKVASLGNKRSEWCKSHHDEMVKVGKKLSLWAKTHKDEKRAQIEKKIATYYSDTKNKEHLSASRIKWCKENRDRLKEIGDKISSWYKNNKEKVRLKALKCSNNYKETRRTSDFSALLSIIHEDYVNDLLSGSLDTTSIIKTKCPICCGYSYHRLGNVFIISRSSLKFGTAPLCDNCKINLNVSYYEQEVANYISSFYNGECIRNNRCIISPFELDLYYPEKKIAIEFNGDYWHDENHKHKNYHYNKFKACLEKGIVLVSIFEHEWNTRRDSISKYMLDLFNFKCNSLSVDLNGFMNNNYPLPNVYNISLKEYVESYYTSRDSKVFTCGYSKL